MTTHSNYEQLDETKVLRDPIHGYINVDYKLIWDLIDTKEFQRLRRIHQLGGTYQVYHTAEHSRFSHSLGVYELVRTMVERVKGLYESLTEREYLALLCAGLLHDVGHGPFSHAFEVVTDVNHEEFTHRILVEDSDINKLLKEVDEDFPALVASIINHTHPRKLLVQIISSQLDADRMDYLLRDSYFTGVSYGEFDLFRILRTMRIVDDQLVVKSSGIHAIEDYIMARYQMYWQVYLHPTSRSFDTILYLIFTRMKELYKKGNKEILDMKYFIPFLKKDTISLRDHLLLDENITMAEFIRLEDSNDPILRDLARRLLDRDLFQYVDYENEEQLEAIKQQVKDAGYDPDYYVNIDKTSQTLYKPYNQEDDSDERIMVKIKDNSLLELSKASEIVNGFVRTSTDGNEKKDEKIFFPKEIVYESTNS